LDGADRGNFPVSSDVSSCTDAHQLFKQTSGAAAAAAAS